MEALDRILGEDFLLIDVMTGSELKKPDLLAILRSGQLKFEAIEPVESQVRLYGITAVITGRTQMSGRFGETPFTASSRYTDVFVKDQGSGVLCPRRERRSGTDGICRIVKASGNAHTRADAKSRDPSA